MRNCNDISGKLSSYLDNQLHENDRKMVVKHLENCSSCKAELEALKNIIEYTGEIEEIGLPEEYNNTLHEKLESVNHELFPKKEKVRFNYYRWAAGLVAVFTLAFVGFNVGYFKEFLNPKADVAYVKDASLNTVSGDQIEIANQKSMKEDSILKDKQIENSIAKNNGNTQLANSTVKSNTNQKSSTSANLPQPSTAGGTAAKASAPSPPRIDSVNFLKLSIDDSSDAYTSIVDSVKNNGGQIQENQKFGIMAFRTAGTERDFTISVPKESYSAVVASLEKIGTVSRQPLSEQSVDAAAQSSPAAASKSFGIESTVSTYSDKAETNVTIELKVQQK